MAEDKELSSRYYNFLIDLYNISKNGSFSFKPLVSKHKLGKSIQTILTRSELVEKEGKHWIWTANKPTKAMTNDIIKDIREYNANNNIKSYAKKINESTKSKVLIKESIELNPLVDQYNKLEQDLKEVTEGYANYIHNTDIEIEQLKLKVEIAEKLYKELQEDHNEITAQNLVSNEKYFKELNSFREKNLELQIQNESLKDNKENNEELIEFSNEEHKKVQLENLQLRSSNFRLNSEVIQIQNKLKHSERELLILKENLRSSKIMKILAFLNKNWYVNLFVYKT